jgi:predicted nucleotidyltransferase
MTLPPDVSALIVALLAGLREALGDNLLGVYPRGSLALGDFDPGYSDVDVLVVTQQRVSEGEFAALAALHDRLRTLPNRYAEALEAAYIDAESVRRFVPGQRHPTITSHDPFRWERHDGNWVLDRWQTRQSGIAWYGPDPRTVIDEISDADLREAARVRILEWAQWAQAVPERDQAWIAERCHQAYVIETMCRALHALSHPGLATKPQAVAWAFETLPDPWLDLLRRSRYWRMEEYDDPETAAEALAFIGWAGGQAAR